MGRPGVKRRRVNESTVEDGLTTTGDGTTDNNGVAQGATTPTDAVAAQPPQHAGDQQRLPCCGDNQPDPPPACTHSAAASAAATDEATTPLVVFLDAKRQHQERDTIVSSPRGSRAASAKKCAAAAERPPPTPLPGGLTAALLPFPLDSLGSLSRYLEMHCKRLAARRPLVNEAFLVNPLPTAVILRAIGYLKHAPLLRCVLMHHALLTQDYALTLRILDVLRRDVTQVSMRMESTLRETLFDVARVSSDAIVKHALFVSSFTVALRRDTQLRLDRLKNEGPRPALLIVPSAISVANFGLYVRGSMPADAKFLGYGGELEDVDAHGSGYRMQAGKGAVVDAHTERCLCSMMNDGRPNPSLNNCRFAKSRYGVRAATKRAVQDEELFVSYGKGFHLDAAGVAATFSRSLAADFAWMAKGTHLPAVDAQVAAVMSTPDCLAGKKNKSTAEGTSAEDEDDV